MPLSFSRELRNRETIAVVKRDSSFVSKKGSALPGTSSLSTVSKVVTASPC